MFYLKLLTRKYIFCILILIFSLPLYSQVVEEIDFQDFVDTFISQEALYSDIGSDIANIVGSSVQMEALFQDSLLSVSFDKLIDLAQNPSNLLETTENESIILLIGTTIAFLEAYRSQNEMNIVLLDRIRSRMSFMAASGDNYGLIIPTYFPLGIFGVSMYMNMPDYIRDPIPLTLNYGYAAFANAISSIPMPHIQVFSQINFWTVPLSMGLRLGFLPGLESLYKQFILDVGVKSLGFHVGIDLKYLIYRDKYFFLDLRADFNFDMGNFDMHINRNLYIPMELGSSDGRETGVVFNGDIFSDFSWKIFAITPKIVGGFKFQEKVPVVDYFAIYGSVGLDLVFGNIETITGINSVSTHVNIANNKHTITDIALPNSELASKYFLYDVRLSLTLDIFYQSFSVEYGVLSKNFAISFTPFVLKF